VSAALSREPVDPPAEPLTAEAERVETLADLARLLRQLRRREARGRGDTEFTYRELAAKTGWSQAAVGEYLAGRTLPPTDRFDVLISLLGATAAEQRALATGRDRVDEHRRRSSTGRRRDGAPVPRQLPGDGAGFAGRGRELATLDDLLRRRPPPPAAPICVVSGTAGVGKTALAVHWAHRAAGRFPDGQLYLNLRGFDPAAAPVTPAEAVRGFLDALAVPAHRLPVGLPAQTGLYRSLMAGRRLLVVLDNARDAAQVRPLLPGAPGCLTLITSRDQLAGLVAAGGASPVPLAPLPDAEARELLIHRLGAARVHAEPSIVDEIVARCAGLPLALAIVSAHAATRPGFGLGALADRLRRASGALDALAGGDPETDIRTVFSWSYQALSPAAARLFRLLAVHPGPDIGLPAVASLAGVAPARVRAALAELCRASLLSEPAADRYACHDLLRAYAAELAGGTGRAAGRRAAVRRIADHYLHSAYRADRVRDPTREPLAAPPISAGVAPEQPGDPMSWFVAERPVLLAVARLIAARGLDRHACELARCLLGFLDMRGHWRELITIEEAALDAAGRLGDPVRQAGAHRGLARAYARLGHDAEVEGHLAEALALFERAGDATGLAHTHLNLAWLCEQRDDRAGALDHDRRALALFRAAGDRAGQARALNSIGWSHARLGDHRAALEPCREALALFGELGDRNGQAVTWDSLGYAHQGLGEHGAAIDCFQRAVALYAQLGDRYFEAVARDHLGDAHHAAGHDRPARAAWLAAHDVLVALDHPDADPLRAKLATARAG